MAHEQQLFDHTTREFSRSSGLVTKVPRHLGVPTNSLGLAALSRIPAPRPSAPARGEITALIDLSFDDDGEDETRALPGRRTTLADLRAFRSTLPDQRTHRSDAEPRAGGHHSADDAAVTRVMSASELPDHWPPAGEGPPPSRIASGAIFSEASRSSGRHALLPPAPAAAPPRAHRRSWTLLEIVLGAIAVVACGFHVAHGLEAPGAHMDVVAHSVSRSVGEHLGAAGLSNSALGTPPRCATLASPVSAETGRVLSLDELPVIQLSDAR